MKVDNDQLGASSAELRVEVGDAGNLFDHVEGVGRGTDCALRLTVLLALARLALRRVSKV